LKWGSGKVAACLAVDLRAQARVRESRGHVVRWSQRRTL